MNSDTQGKVAGVFLLLTWCFGVTVASGYTMDLGKVKEYFLSGDYKATIAEGEKVLEGVEQSPGLDELYYILGVSYLKDGNYLRASDIFEIILKEFKGSAFTGEAMLGLGDTHFLRGEFDAARAQYQALLDSDKDSKLLPLVYYRLSQCALKMGKTEEAKTYVDTLTQKFPGYLQMGTVEEVCPVVADFYSVQVGSFSRQGNAEALTQKLIAKGYAAYTEVFDKPPEAKKYRVKAGKLKTRQEALSLAEKLTQEGYPTRICP